MCLGGSLAFKLYVAERAADKPPYDGTGGIRGDTSQRVDQPDPIADLKMGWRFHTPPVPERQTIPALVRGVHTHQRGDEGEDTRSVATACQFANPWIYGIPAK